jgi:hypothetical protein
MCAMGGASDDLKEAVMSTPLGQAQEREAREATERATYQNWEAIDGRIRAHLKHYFGDEDEPGLFDQVIGRVIGEERAAFDRKLAELEWRLEQKAAVEQQVREIALHLDARQSIRDEARRGKTGRQGERGARGERGPAGPRGPAGRPAPDQPAITGWKIDRAGFRAFPLMSDGRIGPELNLRTLFEEFQLQTSSS